MSKYDRTEIINRLVKNGLKPVYNKKNHQLMYFKKPKKVNLGIKLWGYIDFLKVNIVEGKK